MGWGRRKQPRRRLPVPSGCTVSARREAARRDRGRAGGGGRAGGLQIQRHPPPRQDASQLTVTRRRESRQRMPRGICSRCAERVAVPRSVCGLPRVWP
eukprot:3914786-Rhodomonas_salina.2